VDGRSGFGWFLSQQGFQAGVCADHAVHGRPLARPNKAMHLAPSAQVIGALCRIR